MTAGAAGDGRTGGGPGTATPPRSAARDGHPNGTGSSVMGVVRSEWTKFRSIRATVLLIAGALAVSGFYSLLFSTAAARDYAAATAADRAAFDPAVPAFRGLFLVQLLVSAVGVLTVTSEYASGTMRPSTTAVPRRGRLLAGKSVVAALVLLPSGTVIALVSFLVSQAVLAAQDTPSMALSDAGVPGAIAGAGLFLTLIGLYGVALGFLLRRTAGAVSLGSFLLLTPGMASLFPEGLARWMVKYWPDAAGAQIFAIHPQAEGLAPVAGLGVLVATVTALLWAALAVFRGRDV
ncbi:hypothetical protein [Microbispora sp. NPDC049125]|uniref:hypothetical protein n=1 Tax=Microbispora sp. NPDC049125 TaxID=3154929 RepID=UPI003467C72D